MSLEQNKAVVKRIYTEANDGQQYGVLDELCAPDLLIHDPLAGDQRGIEAFKGLLMYFRQAFPEQRTELHQLVADGDYVSVLHTHHAFNGGSFNGMPPTNRQVTVLGNELFRFQAGKIVEFWRFDADLSLLIQLGVLPAPALA